MAHQVTSDSPRPQYRGDVFLSAIVVLTAGILRVGWPTLAEFKFSEARLAALVLELTTRGHLPLVGVPSSAGFDHSPLSVYLYIPGFLLTTNPVAAVIYSGLVGTAAVVLCWRLARRWPWAGRPAALVAALLLAVGPWSVAFSRKIWQIAFVPFLALAFVGLMISALVDGKGWKLAWALVVYAVLIQVHPSAVSLAPAIVLWLIILRKAVRWQPLLAGGILGALTGLPFAFHQVQNDWPILTAMRMLPKAVWDLSAVQFAWEMITGRGIYALAGDAYPLLERGPEIAWTFNLLGWVLVASVLWLTKSTVSAWKAPHPDKQRQARMDLFLLLWLIIPIVFNLRHNLELHLHFFALVAPAACLIVGRAVGALLQSPKPMIGFAGGTGLGLLALAQVVALGLAGSFVATHDTPGGFGTPLFRFLDVSEHALKTADELETAEVLVVGQGDSVIVDETPAIFDVLLRRRTSYRFVDGHSTALFPPHRALVLLTPGAGEAIDWYGPWPSINASPGYQLVILDGSWPSEGLTSVAGPRSFQTGVEVQGYALQNYGGMGDQVRVWFLWQVLWLDPNATHFSVRLLDSRGQPCGQTDSVGYPVLSRRKGDRVLNWFDITLSSGPSSDRYETRVRLYTYPQMVTVPVIDGAGNPVSDAVMIGVENVGP